MADLASVVTGVDVAPGVAELDTAWRLRTGQPLVLGPLREDAG